jgi:hypothetical protein
VSLGIPGEEYTFNLVADGVSAELDALQYLDHGPCLQAVETGDLVEITTADLLDERRWLVFARAEAALGVASTLSLPMMGRATWSRAKVELVEVRHRKRVEPHASIPDAFDEHQAQLAAICRAPGAWRGRER